eukprot:TRINITY_DN3013_c0_g1_i6.p1 TRINITY_DN3013_c0_g1~~TRINITY_DN3013_c0_g1_i6.p1  ORF type:complete len:465 (+),score=102.79 TRINITY_DN3013_c0_g1_i6:148-1542(+)
MFRKAILKRLGEKKFSIYLKDTYRSLSSCGDPKVRRSITSSFHVIATLLGNNCGIHLKDIFLKLLRDPKMEVKEPLLLQIESILCNFNGMEESQRSSFFHSFSNIVSDLMPSLKNWRVLSKFVEQWAHFYKYYSTFQIVEQWIPLLFSLMSQSVAPVKQAAINSLCTLLRQGIRNNQARKSLCNQLTQEFIQSNKGFSNRMLFLDLCFKVASTFSRKFYKEYFFDAALEVAQNPIPNVRIKACILLPIMKRMCKMPYDSNQLRKLNNCAILYQRDLDKDVCLHSKDLMFILKRIETANGGFEREDDLIDRRKEEEEEDMFKADEKEADEARRKEDEARQEFRRKLAEKEQEINMKTKIFGKRTKVFTTNDINPNNNSTSTIHEFKLSPRPTFQRMRSMSGTITRKKMVESEDQQNSPSKERLPSPSLNLMARQQSPKERESSPPAFPLLRSSFSAQNSKTRRYY